MKDATKALEAMFKMVSPHIREMHKALNGGADVTVIFTAKGQKGCAIFSSAGDSITQEYLIEKLKEHKAADSISGQSLL